MFNNIKAIMFDLDNTLLDRNLGAYLVFRKILIEYSDLKQEDTLFEAAVHDLLNVDEFGNGSKELITKTLNKYGVKMTTAQYCKWWFDTLGSYEPLFEHTIETLEYLKKKYKLAIVTNGDSIGQRNKITRNGLDKYFDVIVISKEVGSSKPDTLIYQEALKQLNVTAQEALFVGDTYPTDILGAFKAGIKPIWLWTDNSRQNQDGVIRINDIMDLKNLL